MEAEFWQQKQQKRNLTLIQNTSTKKNREQKRPRQRHPPAALLPPQNAAAAPKMLLLFRKQKVVHAAEPATKRRPLSPFAKEATLLILWALCAFLFFSYLGFWGISAIFLQIFLFGLFGTLAYLLPILLAFASGFLISNNGS